MPRRPKRTTGNCLVSDQGNPSNLEVVEGGNDNYLKQIQRFFSLLAKSHRLRLEGDWWRIYLALRSINHPDQKLISQMKLSSTYRSFNPVDRSPTKDGKKIRSEKPTNAKFALMWYTTGAHKEQEDDVALEPRLRKVWVPLNVMVPKDQLSNIKRFINTTNKE